MACRWRPPTTETGRTASPAARFLAGTAIVAGCAALAPSAPAADLVGRAALLQGLDKVTARISAVEIPVGETARFGTLEITVHRCLKRPPEEPPESAALLEIRDVRPGEEPAPLFRGWMFASSPALSALEHPVYDVWVKDCVPAKSSADNGPR
jgi:hypothetical protein